MRLCARCSRPFLAPGPSGFPGAGSLFCSKTCRLETWACLFAEMCPPPPITDVFWPEIGKVSPGV